MKGCSPPVSRADAHRYAALQELGCICCRIDGHPRWPVEMHHVVQSDNQKTLPLDSWHHRGEPLDGYTVRETRDLLGPSLALEKREFERVFGTEEELLEFVNHMLTHDAVMVA